MAFQKSGNSIVDRIGEMNFKGNIIHEAWYSTIRKKNNKAYILAILILSEIVYWYRPREERDEESGCTVCWKKRFQGDKLKKSYDSLAEKFGSTKDAVRDAVSFLCSLGVIDREFRTVTLADGTRLGNVMFLGLDPEMLYRLTYPEDVSDDDGSDKPEIADNDDGDTLSVKKPIGVGEKSDRGRKISRQVSEKNPIAIGRNSETNTKSSTENTTESDPINPINPKEPMDESCEKEIDGIDDTLSNRASFREMLKNRIDWNAVTVENSCNPDLIDELLELMLDVMVSKKGTFRINGEEIPAYDLRLRFMKLKTNHISYVVRSLNYNTTQIVNMRNYMLTALYNSYGTMEQSWISRIRHDMYGEDQVQAKSVGLL
ncbi:hypothetical protein SAMN02910370_02091 [Lachnospiraceae bacterium XPB1003]|nr:hypothetical protein SAMN02910370_02091 [Lachnospiraceae bacterium XPB1003]